MPYITREDGERFIIPSYRDTLSAKKSALLKREILLLSANYGEYITLQRKNIDQYEVAFSNEPGYLLGECVWAHFNRPFDMIYCEAIANTTEAILVIVKNGSVYLDGSFPIDSIPEELVIFKTQKNNFDIFIYGDVPISQNEEPGKFSFDSGNVRSFTVLDAPVFPTLKGVKALQLQLIDSVLKSQGIGVFPVQKLIWVLVTIVLLWFLYQYLSSEQQQIVPRAFVDVVNPYQEYYQSLTSPDPSDVINELTTRLNQLYSIPGWQPTELTYSAGIVSAKVISLGGKLNILHDWSQKNGWQLTILAEGVSLKIPSVVANRNPPTSINSMAEVLATIIDRISYVMPGNHVKMSNTEDRSTYGEAKVAIDFNNISPGMLLLIGDQLKNLPLVVNKINLNMANGFLTGTIDLKLLGYNNAQNS